MAALALAVDALVQADDPEDVVVDLTGEVLLDRPFEARELVFDLRIEGTGAQFDEVDCHRGLPGRGASE